MLRDRLMTVIPILVAVVLLTGGFLGRLSHAEGSVDETRIASDSSPNREPVVLIHGINSDPKAFGNMKSLLESLKKANGVPAFKGFAFDYFSQTSLVGTGAQSTPIETLAGDLVVCLRALLSPEPDTDRKINNIGSCFNPTPTRDEIEAIRGATKVHIVAHSMGGLITRAYIAGLSFPYNNDIDKFIMLATPNYGARWVDVFPWASGKQVEQMHYNSDFIVGLNEKWEKEFPKLNPSPNILTIAGTKDNIVLQASAALPDPEIPVRYPVRYVEKNHCGGFDFCNGLVNFCDEDAIACVRTEAHPTWPLVRDFLLNDHVGDSCTGCGISNEGLLLLRFKDVEGKVLTVQPDVDEPLTQCESSRSSNSTEWRQPGTVTLTNADPGCQQFRVQAGGFADQTLRVMIPEDRPAMVEVTMAKPNSPVFRGRYYNGRRFDLLPVLERDDPTIDFHWDVASPAPGIVGRDDFSVNWEGTVPFAAGTYTFTTVSDDGVRLYVDLEHDDRPLIDNWTDHPSTTNTATRTLTAGNHTLRMEYYENGGGAVAKLRWDQSTAAPTTGTLKGRIQDQNGTLIVAPGVACPRTGTALAVTVRWTPLDSGGTPAGTTAPNQCNPEPFYSTTLAAGRYTVSLEVPAGWEVVGGNNVSVTIPAGGEAHHWFTVRQSGGPTTDPFGVLDAPSANATVTGPVSVAGWVLDQEDATLTVELLVDNQSVSSNPTRSARPDVCAAFPAITHCASSQPGFTFTWNTAAVTNGAHTLAIRVTDPGGRNMSFGSRTVTVSNTACTFTLSSSGQSFGASGGSGSVGVTAQVGCSWSATSSASWLTITSGSPGSGSGTVVFSVAANPSTSQRQATITVQGQVFTVTQAGTTTAPDLVVTQVTGPSCGGIGGTGQFTATVLNQGNGFASATSTGFYLSTDSTVNTSDLPLGSCGTSSLNPNQSTQCSAILTIPNTPGTFFIGAIANDSNAGVIESNPSNNALAGGQITVSGNCPGALGTILVQANLNGNPITLTSGSFTLIGPGETLNWTGGIPATFNEKAAGTWTISNITNGPANSSLTSVTPSSTQTLSGGSTITFTLNFSGTFLPDLQILDLSPPSGQQAVIGGQAALNGIRVQNFGPAPTGIPFSVGLYWSADSSFSTSNDVFAGSCTFPALQANQQGFVDPCVISVPISLGPGVYFVVGYVDFNQQIAETNEGNNVKVQTQWPINLVR